MNPLFVSGVAMVVVLVAFEWFLPRLTRPDLWFGVTVAPGFRASEEGRSALGRFRGHLLFHGAVSLGVLVLLRRSPFALAAGVLYLLAGTFEAFLRGRRLTLPHASTPSPARGASLAPRGPMPGRALFAVPFALLAAVVVWLALRYPALPDRLPTHFDANGLANGFAAKSPLSVFGPLILSAALLLLLLLLARAIWRTRRIQHEGPRARAEERFRRGTVWILLAASVFEAAINAMVSLAIAGVFRPGAWPIVIGTAVFATGVLIWAALLGQGGTRTVPSPEQPVGDRTPDARWLAGLIYVNRADPAFLVEKRFGVGYTLNFGHPLAWVFLGLILVLPLVAVFFGR